MSNQLRPGLAEPPERMRSLPIDERGYPVPWFVDWIDGKPEFRAMDPEKFMRAIRFKLCWVCGIRLGRYVTFVAGPMCGINRTSAEPPSHWECAEYSAINCPFLSQPDTIRRVDEQIGLDMKNTAGFAITRNPGVAMLWTTIDYHVFNDGRNKPLVRMGDPTKVTWYCKGRPATREEVMHSIETGIYALESAAATEKGGLEYLQKCRDRFEPFIPAA